MSKKKYIIFMIVLLITVSAAAVVFLTLRSRNITVWKDEPEQETTYEETQPETENVIVEDVSVVDQLSEVLTLAVTSEDGQNMDEIMAGLQELADCGNSDAQYFLGELYFQGIGTEPDMETAGIYFREACENGNKKAMLLYGKMLFMGDGVPQNYDESASCFCALADSDGEAAYLLGIMYNLGMGVPRNAEKAKKLIDKSAELGYDRASSYTDKILAVGTMTVGTEGFVPKAKEIRNLEYVPADSDLQQMIDEYDRKLKETESYRAFDEEILGLYDIDETGISMITLFGNDGYLFHQNENDGTSLHDYIGDNYFSEDELQKIAENLKKQKEWVESQGSQFVLLLIPNKESIYPEHMPAYISRVNEVPREDQLVAYLRENTDINVVYVKDTLQENKDDFTLYYKTDTHANMVGSLFMVSDLFQSLYGKLIEPDLDKFVVHMEDYMGDLGRMAKCTDRYARDKVYFYPESSVGDDEKIDSSMMLVGDSFSEFINIEAAYYLSGGVDHRMITEYDYNYHSATQAGFNTTKPDYVIWECVERYLDRLK